MHLERKFVRRYTVLIIPEGEEEGHVALVPALPGCEARGDTREEAVANARSAVTRYVASLKEAGQVIPADEPDSWTVMVEIPD